MQAISIIGFSNSGKTTLISRLSECLEARGLKVAIAKHTHHELDKPDTDTALLMSPKRTIVGLSNTKDGGGEAMIHWGHPCFLRDLVPLLDADILLVDDVQFIAGKKQTQEEFFHTFNTLYESGRQIVLTSDRPPSEMTQLEDRLRTRFEWGLLVDVAPPDFETRLAIVKNKAALLGMELPDKISAYIAENVTANVRQLEGTINKILAYKDLLGNDTDEETVTRAIQDMLRRSNEYVPTPEAILEYISKYYSLDESVIRGQQRVRDAVSARQIAMYLIRSMTNLSLDEIGKVFDNRDHSTVLYSIQQIEKKMKKDAAFAEMVKEIKTNINSKR